MEEDSTAQTEEPSPETSPARGKPGSAGKPGSPGTKLPRVKGAANFPKRDPYDNTMHETTINDLYEQHKNPPKEKEPRPQAKKQFGAVVPNKPTTPPKRPGSSPKARNAAQEAETKAANEKAEAHRLAQEKAEKDAQEALERLANEKASMENKLALEKSQTDKAKQEAEKMKKQVEDMKNIVQKSEEQQRELREKLEKESKEKVKLLQQKAANPETVPGEPHPHPEEETRQEPRTGVEPSSSAPAQDTREKPTDNPETGVSHTQKGEVPEQPDWSQPGSQPAPGTAVESTTMDDDAKSDATIDEQVGALPNMAKPQDDGDEDPNPYASLVCAGFTGQFCEKTKLDDHNEPEKQTSKTEPDKMGSKGLEPAKKTSFSGEKMGGVEGDKLRSEQAESYNSAQLKMSENKSVTISQKDGEENPEADAPIEVPFVKQLSKSTPLGGQRRPSLGTKFEKIEKIAQRHSMIQPKGGSRSSLGEEGSSGHERGSLRGASIRASTILKNRKSVSGGGSISVGSTRPKQSVVINMGEGTGLVEMDERDAEMRTLIQDKDRRTKLETALPSMKNTLDTINKQIENQIDQACRVADFRPQLVNYLCDLINAIAGGKVVDPGGMMRVAFAVEGPQSDSENSELDVKDELDLFDDRDRMEIVEKMLPSVRAVNEEIRRKSSIRRETATKLVEMHILLAKWVSGMITKSMGTVLEEEKIKKAQPSRGSFV